MRLFNLLPIILAAIFFAGSVSADHKCGKNKSLGGKVYEVCKSWRADQGGPMPDDQMQHCRNVLCRESEQYCSCVEKDCIEVFDQHCVGLTARTNAKDALGYW